MTPTLCTLLLTCIVIAQSTQTTNTSIEDKQADSEAGYRDARERMGRAEEERPAFEKRLMEVRLPVLEEHATGGDVVKFMTDPATPYLERMAVARRCVDFVEAHDAIKAIDAYRELEQAMMQGELGLLPHPLDAGGGMVLGVRGPKPGTQLTLAGHEWIVPEKPEQWPILLSEKEAASWPWQAWDALREFKWKIRIRAQNPAWSHWIVLNASDCNEQNHNSADRALDLLEVLDGYGGVEAMAVLVNIARSEFAAQEHTLRAASMIADFGRRGTNQREAMAWDLAAAYIIRNAAHTQARHAAAEGVCIRYREFRHFPYAYRRPAHSILAAGDRALKDDQGERWSALAGLAAPCMQRLDRWDFRILFDIRPENTEAVDALFMAFKGLYALDRPLLVEDAKKMPELRAELRRALQFWSEPRTVDGP